MHGLIHVILKELVLQQFGEDKWAAICTRVGLTDDAAILELKQYDDATTVAGINAAATVLGVSFDDALKVYGGFFVEFVHMGGHLKMLQSMGDDLEEFMRNINHLHYNLERRFRTCNFPCFTISQMAEKGTFKLSYSSERGAALASLVEGVLPVLAASLHQQEAQLVRTEVEPGHSMSWIVSTKPLATKPQHLAAEVSVEQSQKLKCGSGWHLALIGCCCSDSGPAAGDYKVASAVSIFTQEYPILAGETVLVEGHSTVAHSTVNLDEMIALGLPPEEAAALDALHQKADESGDPGAVLMKAVPASYVASDWDAHDQLQRTSLFWGTNAGDARDFARSQHVDLAARFVTHSWMPPDNWESVMGSNCDYGEMKAAELKIVAEDIAEQLGCKWEEVTFWIDKCCIPQRHPLMPKCVGLIEDFLQRCEGMVVLLTWQYFERLWCMYEWAAFLVYHNPEDVQICVDAFMRPASHAFYISAIANFAVADAKCYHEPDREVLKSKIADYYFSEQDFEAFARGTAIAILAVTGCRRASRHPGAYEADFLPWLELAERLGFVDLAAALRTAEPLAWRAAALGDSRQIGTLGQSAKGWQNRFSGLIDTWFAENVSPVLAELRATSVRPEVTDSMQKKNSLRRSEKRHSQQRLATQTPIAMSTTTSATSRSGRLSKRHRNWGPPLPSVVFLSGEAADTRRPADQTTPTNPITKDAEVPATPSEGSKAPLIENVKAPATASQSPKAAHQPPTCCSLM